MQYRDQPYNGCKYITELWFGFQRRYVRRNGGFKGVWGGWQEGMDHGPSKIIYHKRVTRLTFLEVWYLGFNTFQTNICPHYTNELVVMITRQGSSCQQALDIK